MLLIVNMGEEKDLEDDIRYCSNKKFSFSPKKDSWLPPDFEKIFATENWKLPYLTKWKQELNSWKNRLNDFELQKWHTHTRKTNPAGQILSRVKEEINPELPTQAWLKMYEILCSYQVIPRLAVEAGKLRSVHLCECPGAFITALNHYLKLNFAQLDWDWMASTLNPYFEENTSSTMIQDDRFIISTLNKWKFGRDGTGDLLILENMYDLVEKCQKSLGPVLLLTADGGIDCESQPDKQEELSAPLHYCETVAALHILAPGGTFILKAFTMFDSSSVCLLYLLNSVFRYVHVFKPMSSREGNSECYVICINFDGTEDKKDWLKALRKHFGPNLPSSSMFPLFKIPEEFIEEVHQCSEQFKRYQEKVIERNILLFTIEQPVLRTHKIKRRMMADAFMKKFKLKPIGEFQKIVGNKKLEEVLALQISPRDESGTFNQRRSREQLPPEKKLLEICNAINKISVPDWSSDFYWIESLSIYSDSLCTIELRKPVNVIRSSRFCPSILVDKHYEFDCLLKAIGKKPSDVFQDANYLSENAKRKILNWDGQFIKSNWLAVNFKNCLWSSLCGKSNQMEKRAILRILKAVENSRRGINLVIEGFPLLTQLSVSFLYLLCQSFRKIGFGRRGSDEGILLLFEFQSLHSFLVYFMKQLLTELETVPKTVISSLVPTPVLIGHKIFYERVVTYNCYGLQMQVRNYLAGLCIIE